MSELQKVEGKEMSFIEHLDEFRSHLIRSVIALLVCTIVVFLNKKILFDHIIFGPKDADFLSYQFMCWLSAQFQLGEALCLVPPEFTIANFRMLGEFLAHLQVSFVAGLVLAFPFIMWELWKFIAPGLYETEIKATRGVVAACSTLFLIGVGFGYFIIIPFSISFLVPYSISADVSDYIQLGDYIGFVTMICLAAGIMFELPLVIFFLAKLGIVGPAFLRSHRKHAIIVILLASAIITPPDVTSQILIGMPVMLLYEVGIRIAARIEKRQKEQEEAEGLIDPPSS
jgi:sec-independent protein translocase protein TatC